MRDTPTASALDAVHLHVRVQRMTRPPRNIQPRPYLACVTRTVLISLPSVSMDRTLLKPTIYMSYSDEFSHTYIESRLLRKHQLIMRGYSCWSYVRDGLLCFVAISIALAWFRSENDAVLGTRDGVECDQPHWKFHLVAYDPFIMHIQNFVTTSEREYLLDLGYVRVWMNRNRDAARSDALQEIPTHAIGCWNEQQHHHAQCSQQFHSLSSPNRSHSSMLDEKSGRVARIRTSGPS